MSTTPFYNILIVGAGPAGLTLANLIKPLLLEKKISLIVYEAETSPTARTQGGTLDLHHDTGLLALQEAGLWGKAKPLLRFDSQDMCIATKTFEKIVEERGERGAAIPEDGKLTIEDRPEIDRIQLRDLLIRGVEEYDIIQWGQKVTNITPSSSSTVQYTPATATNSTATQSFDLIIGADGTWSKVRPLIHSTAPAYSSISCIELNYPHATLNPIVDRIVANGNLLSMSEGKGLNGQRLADQSVRVYVTFKSPETYLDEQFPGPVTQPFTETIRDKLLGIFEDWNDELKTLVKYASTEYCIKRPLFELPVGLTWEHKPGLTLVGDAAHVFTPYSGEGVNLSMQDSLKLSRAIKKAVEAAESAVDGKEGLAVILAECVKEFETEMFARMKVAARDTMHNKKIFFSDEFPKDLETCFGPSPEDEGEEVKH